MENRYKILIGKTYKNPDDGKSYTIEDISEDGKNVKLSQPISSIAIGTILGRWQECDSSLQTESLICG